MPVLILAVLSVILFVVTLVLLGFAEIAENKRKKKQAVGYTDEGGPFRILSVCDAFEEEYAVLWETQAPALSLIASAGIKGASRKQLLAAYQRAAEQFPELYEGSCFEQWLEFLQNCELITVQQDRIHITPEGKEFLRFRVLTNTAA